MKNDNNCFGGLGFWQRTSVNFNEHSAATTIAGNPILILNTKDGIKAFANICRHRGAPLMWDGNKSRQQYCVVDTMDGSDDDGVLIGTPTSAVNVTTTLFKLYIHLEGPWVFVAWTAQTHPERYFNIVSTLGNCV